MKTGYTGAAPHDVYDILDIYGVAESVKEELVQFAQ
jgi:hypothetical protein